MQFRRHRDAASILLVVVAAATLLGSGRAQAQTETRLAISGGIGTDQRGLRSNALTVAPSLSVVPATGASLSLARNLTRFGSSAWSLGAGAAFAGRDAVAGPLAFTLDASASGSQLAGQGSASASFASGELLPALQLDAGPLTLFGGARAASGYASLDVARQPLPGFNAGSTTQSQSRSGFGPTFGVSFVATSSPDGTFRLGVREDRLRVAEVAVTDHALSASLVAGALTLSGNAGQRDASDEQVGFGSAALSIALGNDVALDAAAGRYPSNRLSGTPGGDYFNVGLSWRFGGARSRLPTSPATRVHGAPRVPSGYTRLAIDAPDSERVDVAGDFNEWTPVPATLAANGVWYADLRIAPGQYRYAFRVNGKEWRVPRGATAVSDGFGGKSTWLIVSESG